jgi:ankyrin repeat protein
MNHCEAARRANLERLRELVTRANVNAVDDSGWIVSYLASMSGQTACAKFLLKMGADVHASDLGGRTALYYAALNGTVIFDDQMFTL